METDKERLLLCYQVNQQVVQGKFPLNRELAFELASLMAQVGFCTCCARRLSVTQIGIQSDFGILRISILE